MDNEIEEGIRSKIINKYKNSCPQLSVLGKCKIFRQLCAEVNCFYAYKTMEEICQLFGTKPEKEVDS